MNGAERCTRWVQRLAAVPRPDQCHGPLRVKTLRRSDLEVSHKKPLSRSLGSVFGLDWSQHWVCKELDSQEILFLFLSLILFLFCGFFFSADVAFILVKFSSVSWMSAAFLTCFLFYFIWPGLVLIKAQIHLVVLISNNSNKYIFILTIFQNGVMFFSNELIYILFTLFYTNKNSYYIQRLNKSDLWPLHTASSQTRASIDGPWVSSLRVN